MSHKLIECSCAGHGITVGHNLHVEAEAPHWNVDLALWTQGYEEDNRMGFWGKLRLVWHIIRHGTQYNDQLVLDYTSTRELAQDLTAIADEWEMLTDAWVAEHCPEETK